MSIKCKYCRQSVRKNASALKKHLNKWHPSIAVERAPDGSGSVHVFRPQNNNETKYSLSTLLYNYKNNKRIWLFFDTLLTLARKAHFLADRCIELQQLRDNTQIIYEYIGRWNAYSVLMKYKCNRKLAILADEYMNGIGITLYEYCKYIIKHLLKPKRSFTQLPLHRHQRNQKKWLNHHYKNKPITYGSFTAYITPDSDDDIDLNTSSSDSYNSSLALQSDGGFRLKMSTKLSFAGMMGKKIAMFRLAQDLTECVKYPLPMISAKPVSDSNLFEWHACMVGPPQSNYEDIAFHFIINIGDNYPVSPPDIKLCSYFEHPNVFGKKICLDILEGYIGDESKYIGGWSSAYSMQTVLVQLQQFLFESVDKTSYSKNIDSLNQNSNKLKWWKYSATTIKARRAAKLFKCKKCVHSGNKPWPKPLCLDHRWKFMIPQIEMNDIYQTKLELIKFLERVRNLCILNKWINIEPLRRGSFFNTCLLPWHLTSTVYMKKLKNSSSKVMSKKHIKVIHGLIYQTREWLEMNEASIPSKGLLLLKIYQIESAIDIALSHPLNTNRNRRNTADWLWFNDDTKVKEEEKDAEGGKQWMSFSDDISSQIEALYLKCWADKEEKNQKTKKMGIYYKAYARDKNNNHWIVDIMKMECQCIQHSKIYKIKRKKIKRDINDIWTKILKLSYIDDEGQVNFVDNKKKNNKIVPFPIIDYKKYIGQCAFVDLSLSKLNAFEPGAEPVAETEYKFNGNEENINSNAKNANKINVKIETRNDLPKIGENVIGKIIKIIRYGVFIDIGYKKNAFLHISQIKCPKYTIDHIVNEANEEKQRKIKQKEYAKLKEFKRKKRLKKKNKKKNKNKQNNNKPQTNTFIDSNNDQQEEKQKPLILPRTLSYMSTARIKIGDILTDLYVFDIDSPIEQISLSQFKPLSQLNIGDKINGYVRSTVHFAAFIDVGCEVDGFLHKNSLEIGLKDRIVFNCRECIEIGQELQLIINDIDLNRNKLQLIINTQYYDNTKSLLLPQDIDESLAVYQSIFGILSDDINDLILKFMDFVSLYKCRKVCKLFERIIDNNTGLKFEIAELKCYHSKKSFRQQSLGFGVKVERYPNSSHICDIEPMLDLLSGKAFHSYNIRESIYKQPFTHWLPVYINPTHGAEAMEWAKIMMTRIVNGNTWSAYYVLKIIPTLMNTMVVRVMKGELHESIVALEGYTMFYHLMLAFIVEYPFLQQFIDKNLGEFVLQTENNIYRNKKHVSSLGEWIALLSASNKYCWGDVCTSYLRECFDRNAKWIIKSNKRLLDESHPKKSRLQKSFKGCQVSLKLCMFHVLFLRLFRYSARSGTLQSVNDTKEKLDKLYGRPTYSMRELLQKHVKRIKNIKTWNEFFSGIGIKCPSDNELYEWLIQSIRNSEYKGYHKKHWYIKKKYVNYDEYEYEHDYDDVADEWDDYQSKQAKNDRSDRW